MSIFFSYSHRDARDARLLFRTLQARLESSWLDIDHLQPGDDLDRRILKAIGECEAAVVCFGPNDFGDYQRDIELNALIDARQRGVRIVTVVLPGCTSQQKTFLERPPFRGLLWLEFPDTVEDEELVLALAAALRGEAVDLPRFEGAPQRPALSPVVERLASKIRVEGSMAIVGSVWGSEAGSLPNNDPHEPHYEIGVDARAPYIGPSELAALMHEVATDDLYTFLRNEIRYWNWMPLDVHRSLGRWARANLAGRSDSQRRIVILTTALDVRIERALMAAQTPFHRFTLSNSGRLMHTSVDSYVSINSKQGPASELRSTAGGVFVRSDETKMTSEALADFDGVTAALGPQDYIARRVDWWDYVQDEMALKQFTRECPDSVFSTAMDVNSETHVLLVKLRGTIEHEESWRASYDNLLAWPDYPNWLMNIIRRGLGVSEILYFGFRLVDPAFLHVYASLFGDQRNGRKDYGTLVCPVDEKAEGHFTRFDMKYRTQVDAAAWRYRLKIFRDQSSEGLLDQLSAAAIAAARRGPSAGAGTHGPGNGAVSANRPGAGETAVRPQLVVDRHDHWVV